LDLVAWQGAVRDLSEEMKAAQEAAARMKTAAAAAQAVMAWARVSRLIDFSTACPRK
jgi:hypothetical protein